MKQTTYEVIVKCVSMGAPALAKEVIDDLNNTLNMLDSLTQTRDNALTKNTQNEETKGE